MACLIGVALVQDLQSLLVQRVLWRPAQQADVIAVQHNHLPPGMRREGVVAGGPRSPHPQALVQHLHEQQAVFAAVQSAATLQHAGAEMAESCLSMSLQAQVPHCKTEGGSSL